MFKLTAWLSFPKHWKVQNDIEERVKELIDWWVHDFFCGFVPKYWSDKYWFEVSPNGRFSEPEQITDEETLKMIIQEVHKHWKEIMWTLNFWYYTKDTFSYLEKIINTFIDSWIDWFVCWNIEIMEYLLSISENIVNEKDRRYLIIKWRKIYLNVSTILSIYNKDALSFILDNYPINRVVLSRDLTLKEIKEICESFPDIKFEVFWEFWNCRYSNWHCFVWHVFSDTHYCQTYWDKFSPKKSLNYKFRKDIKYFLENKLQTQDIIHSFNNEIINKSDSIDLILNGYLEESIDKNELQEFIQFNFNYIKINNINFSVYQPITEENNKFLIKFYNFLKILNWNEILNKFDKEINILKTNIETWKEISKELEKNNLKWKNWIEEKYMDLLYNRNDLSNIIVYKFFNKIKNIETVKIPIRWKIYWAKLKYIQSLIENDKFNIFDFLKNKEIDERFSQYNLDWLKKEFNNL